MNLKRSFTAALALIGAVTLFAPGIVRADQFDKKIIVGFNKPVEIPNGVLEPGTYVFKLADHGNTSNVVQVFNRDETRIYATLFTIPKYRADITDQPVFQFEETNQGEPTAIHAWFYPGEGTGYEFVYSKHSGLQSAAEPAVNERPDNAEAAPAPSEAPAPEEPTSRPPQIVAIERVRIITFLTAPDAPEPDPVATPFEPVAGATTAQPKELPKTASGLPLLALFGMLSLGGAAILQAAGRLSAYFARK